MKFFIGIMSYVKNNWTEGDVITAEKLNNIENGVSDNSDFYLNLTYEQLSQLYSDGVIPIDEELFNEIKNHNEFFFDTGDGIARLSKQIWTDPDFYNFNNIICSKYGDNDFRLDIITITVEISNDSSHYNLSYSRTTFSNGQTS